MSNLLESIISEDYVSATKIFESRIEEIVEQKLLEAKKQVQAEATKISTKQLASDPKLQSIIAKAEKKQNTKQPSSSTDEKPAPVAAPPKVRSTGTIEKAKPYPGGYSPKTAAEIKKGKVPASSVLPDPRETKIDMKSRPRKSRPSGSKKTPESDSWKEFAADYQRKKDMEVKRSEFIKKRPGVVARRLAGKVIGGGAQALGYGIGSVGKNIVRGLADLAEE
jgi:hypothetical protein